MALLAPLLAAALLEPAGAAPKATGQASVTRSCEDITPTAHELRDSRPAGWSVEELRGRRWAAALQPSAGGEEKVEGYAAGSCVVGTWTREEHLAAGSSKLACLEKCSREEGCLGVLWGQVEGLHGAPEHCFLAGVGNGSIVMEYPCVNPALGCPRPLDAKALAELAPTLQCWQQRWQHCTEPSSAGGSAGGSGGAAEWLAELLLALERAKSRLRGFLPLVLALLKRQLRFLAHPGRFTILTAAFRALGRAADLADASMARMLAAGKAALLEGGVEGPAGSIACCLLTSVTFWLIGRNWRTGEVAPRRQQHQPAPIPEALTSAMPEATVEAFTGAEGFSADEPLSAFSADEPMLPHEPPLSPEASADLPEPQVPMPLPTGLPVALGPPDFVEASAASSRRRNRNATPPPPKRMPAWSPVIQEVVDLEESEHFLEQAPPMSANRIRIQRFWEDIENSPEPVEGESDEECPMESQVLKLLNHPEVEVIRKVRFIGEKFANQIANYRCREGDLRRVHELCSKVGLKEGLVNKVLKEYGLPEL